MQMLSSHYFASFETRVNGIPCLIGVTRYLGRDEGTEWEVLDRRGREAPWLERKLTDDERERIECEAFEKAMQEDAELRGEIAYQNWKDSRYGL